MPTYTIYKLQHAIYLAKQIKSQIESQQRRNFDNVIKKLGKVEDLIKEWRVSEKVLRDVPLRSPIVEEEDSREIPEEKVQFIIGLKFQFDKLFENAQDVSLANKKSIEDDGVIDLSDIF